MNFQDALIKVNGEDVTATIGSTILKVPASKAKALKAYDGKTVVFGIRPKDMSDDPEYIAAHPDCVVKSQIKVYELLGAEVFLYFDAEGKQMIARVNPATPLRTGDSAAFAIKMDKAHFFDKETEQTITN